MLFSYYVMIIKKKNGVLVSDHHSLKKPATNAQSTANPSRAWAHALDHPAT